MGKTVDQVLKDIDAILAKSESSCVTALTPVMNQAPRKDQIFACLELFHTQSYELAYNAFSIKDGKLKTDYACLPGFDGQQSFTPDLAKYFEAVRNDLDWGDADGQTFTVEHEKQFSQWFKRVWLAAGGENAKVPTYFCYEKEYSVQDVKTGTVMEELEAAQALGYNVTEASYE